MPDVLPGPDAVLRIAGCHHNEAEAVLDPTAVRHGWTHGQPEGNEIMTVCTDHVNLNVSVIICFYFFSFTAIHRVTFSYYFTESATMDYSV